MGMRARLLSVHVLACAMFFSGAGGLRAAEPPRAPLGPDAYQQPISELFPNEYSGFVEGAVLFQRGWVEGTATPSTRYTGLGPLFIHRSCEACHVRNGRGDAPAEGADDLRSVLIRISVPGRDAHGGPKPHEIYGDQLQTDAATGYAPEARVRLHWHETPVTLTDGTVVKLRRPEIIIRDPKYGPLPANLQTSARISPSVYGLGLLEQVPIPTLEAIAREEKADGVKGRLNMVWSVEFKKTMPGRFGFKANQPDLNQQIAAALAGDMGVTSRRYPLQDCPPHSTGCVKAGDWPEMHEPDFIAVWRYVEMLAAPPRRPMNPAAARGEKLFREIGCAACHRESLPLPNGVIQPYTDLLLHDMGEGLADGRPDFLAGERDWRTTPLWGIGAARAVNANATYLHDGRARTLTEAILWHGGESQTARDRFAKLPRDLRDALMSFLETL